MPTDITTISLGGRFQVNCYLVRTEGAGCVLVDSGVASERGHLTRELERCGCIHGDLKLVVVTHGDPDHAGNCRWVHETYDVPIAMSALDAGMAERGDMFWNRTGSGGVTRTLLTRADHGPQAGPARRRPVHARTSFSPTASRWPGGGSTRR